VTWKGEVVTRYIWVNMLSGNIDDMGQTSCSTNMILLTLFFFIILSNSISIYIIHELLQAFLSI